MVAISSELNLNLKENQTDEDDYEVRFSRQISGWSIALTTIFVAIVVVLTLLQSVYSSAGIQFEPWFIRKLMAEILLGVITQLASLVLGFFLGLIGLSPSRRGARSRIFYGQVVFFFLGWLFFLVFSIEMYRSVTIP